MKLKKMKLKFKELKFEFVLRNFYSENEEFRRRIYIKRESNEEDVYEDDNKIYTKDEITIILNLLDETIHNKLKENKEISFLSNNLNIVFYTNKSADLKKDKKILISFNGQHIQYLYNYLHLIISNGDSVSEDEIINMINNGILIKQEYDEKQLRKYIDILINDYMFKIKSTFNLYKTIIKSEQKYLKEYSKFIGFLATTLDSLQTNFLISARRLLNENENKNIYDLLEICEENYYNFSNNIRDNVKEEIEKLRNYLDSKDELIKNVKKLSNKALAHFDNNYFYDIESAFDKYKFKYDAFEELMDKIYNFLNKINLDLFNTNTGYFITQDPCEEFKSIFEKLKSK